MTEEWLSMANILALILFNYKWLVWLFFLFLYLLLAIILLAVNLIFAPHNPYQEKDSIFECGFHSFLRTK